MRDTKHIVLNPATDRKRTPLLAGSIVFASFVMLGMPLDGSIPHPAGNLRDAEASIYEASDISIALWTFIYAALALLVVLRGRLALAIALRTPFFWLATMLVLVSGLWSPRDSVALPVMSQVLGGIIACLAYAVVFEHRILRWLQVSHMALLANVLINTVLCIVIPAATINDAGRWAGVTGNPNYLGSLAAALAFFAMARFVLDRGENWRLSLASIALAAWVLVSTGSVTSMTATLALVAAAAALPTTASRRPKFVSIAAWLALIVVASALLWLPFSLLTAITGRSENLTGRWDIWQRALELISTRVLFGYGFGANTQNLGILTWATNFHNGFIQIAIISGLCGLTLFCVSLGGAAARVWRAHSRDHRAWLLGVFLLGFVTYNLAEAPVYLARHPLWLIFCTLLFFAATPRRRRGLAKMTALRD